jgi:hypothetical protein
VDYPFPTAQVEVAVPKKFRTWFSAKDSLCVTLQGDVVKIMDGPPLRIVPTDHGYAAMRGKMVVGEFDQHTVRRTVNDRLLRQMSVLRSAIYGVSFPAPLAYVLRDGSLVHPGPCFSKHAESVTLRALFSVKDEDARCSICKEAFV